MSTIHETIDYLEKRVYEFAHLGVVDLENGARLVGHIPHVAEFGYLNCLGYPLEAEKILELEKQFLISFDADLREFFMKYNGLSLYDGAFAFYGKRGAFSRTSGWLNFEPFEISMPNTVERIRDALPSHFFIALFQRNVAFNSRIYYDTKSKKYFECATKNSIEPLHSWDSLSEMLRYYIDLLHPHFDNQGKKISTWRIPDSKPSKGKSRK